MKAVGHEREALAVFEACDTHHDGYITFEEFCAAVGGRAVVPRRASRVVDASTRVECI